MARKLGKVGMVKLEGGFPTGGGGRGGGGYTPVKTRPTSKKSKLKTKTTPTPTVTTTAKRSARYKRGVVRAKKEQVAQSERKRFSEEFLREFPAKATPIKKGPSTKSQGTVKPASQRDKGSGGGGSGGGVATKTKTKPLTPYEISLLKKVKQKTQTKTQPKTTTTSTKTKDPMAMTKRLRTDPLFRKPKSPAKKLDKSKGASDTTKYYRKPKGEPKRTSPDKPKVSQRKRAELKAKQRLKELELGQKGLRVSGTTGARQTTPRTTGTGQQTTTPTKPSATPTKPSATPDKTTVTQPVTTDKGGLKEKTTPTPTKPSTTPDFAPSTAQPDRRVGPSSTPTPTKAVGEPIVAPKQPDPTKPVVSTTTEQIMKQRLGPSGDPRLAPVTKTGGPDPTAQPDPLRQPVRLGEPQLKSDSKTVTRRITEPPLGGSKTLPTPPTQPTPSRPASGGGPVRPRPTRIIRPPKGGSRKTVMGSGIQWPSRLQWKQGALYRQINLQTGKKSATTEPVTGGVHAGTTPKETLKVIGFNPRVPKKREIKMGVTTAFVQSRKIISFKRSR